MTGQETPASVGQDSLRASAGLGAVGCSPVAFPRQCDQTRLFGIRLWRFHVRTGRRQSNICWLVGRGIRALCGWLWPPLAREIARELRSSAFRIGMRCGLPLYRRWVSFGAVAPQPFLHSQDGPLHACIRDMQSTNNRLRWATTLDVQAWAQVWAMGARYGVSNSHNEALREYLGAATKHP